MILELKMGVKYGFIALKAEKWMGGLFSRKEGAWENPQHIFSRSKTDKNTPVCF